MAEHAGAATDERPGASAESGDADAGRLTAEGEHAQDDADSCPPHTAKTGGHESSRRPLRLALVAALIVVVALGTLVGWLGLRVYDSRQIAEEHAAFLATARQGALNLTTISHTEVEDDINRILNTATGSFHDEFRERSVPFVDAVRGAQSTSQGTVIEAALESVQGDTAEALVSVAVTTSVAGAPPQEPRSWRMRITVQKDGDTDKVSNVEFVP